jgi:hypothetical protein
VFFNTLNMDFTLEEIRDILDEMGLKNVPEDHLEQFAKGCFDS